MLVNHWPLTRLPTRVLRYPEFALWCGTTATADWHVRYRAIAVVYGHLHIPRETWEDGVRFVEVSLGYPREWRARASGPAPADGAACAAPVHRALPAHPQRSFHRRASRRGRVRWPRCDGRSPRATRVGQPLCWVVVALEGFDLVVLGVVLPALLQEPTWG